jgi:hypothetical protein
MEPVRLLNRKSTKIWVNIHNETAKNVKMKQNVSAQANQLLPANQCKCPSEWSYKDTFEREDTRLAQDFQLGRPSP